MTDPALVPIARALIAHCLHRLRLSKAWLAAVLGLELVPVQSSTASEEA